MGALVVVLLLGACAGPADTAVDGRPEVPGSGVNGPNVGSVEAFNEAKGVERINFEPYTPTRLASESSIVVYGSVKSIEDGRLYGSGDILMKNVVIGIDPIDVVKDDPARNGDLVYFELSRVDDDASLAKIADVLPLNAHVALFGYPADDPGFEVHGDPNSGREDGSSVYSPLAQGLWFETADGLANVLTATETSDGAWANVDSWAALKAAATP